MSSLFGAAEGEVVTLIEENHRLRAAFEAHLATMTAINEHMGYPFTRPLAQARQALQPDAGNKVTEALRAARSSLSCAVRYWDSLGEQYWESFEPHEPEVLMRHDFQQALQLIAAVGVK